MNRTNAWTPNYHFYSNEADNLPFDPDGAIFWKGRYHVFYLFQDTDINPRGCGWGHASSPDLVTWTFHKPALICDTEEEKSMLSGNALVTLDGRVAIVYSSLEMGMSIAIATDDTLETWEKIPQNPVIPFKGHESPENQVVVQGCGDPYCWIEDGHYFVIIGGKARPYSEYDCAYLYCSDDLIHWKYLRPFYQATDHFSTRLDDCSCPEFFDFGNQKMLIHMTHARGARCYLGDWVMDTFLPKYNQFFNFPGGNLVAPRSLLDDKGRRLVWFWLYDRLFYRQDPSRPPMRQTWSLPRVLEPVPEGNGLRQFVPQEIMELSSAPIEHLDSIPETGFPVLAPYHSRSCRIHVSMTLKKGKMSIDVLSNQDGSESLRLIVDKEAGRIILDHSTAKYPLPNDTYFWVPGHSNPQPLQQEIPWPADENDTYDFDLYLDNCVAELFDSQGRYAASQCIFTSPENDSIVLRKETDSDLAALKLTFHDMRPIVRKFN